MDQPDWQQLRLALAQDRADGLARLYDAAAPVLYRFIRRLTGDDEEAADVLHDLFINLSRAAPQIEQVQDFKAYLFTSARNTVHRRHRKLTPLPGAGDLPGDSLHAPSSPTANLPSREPDAAADALAAERNRRIADALRVLPSDQREVVALKLDSGFTFEAIARQLNIPAATAASRYRYALEHLRRALEGLQHD